MLIKQKYHVKYANFYVASAVTKCSLRVDGFTGNLHDALKEHKNRSFLAFHVYNGINPQKLWIFNWRWFVVFVTTSAIRFILVGYTTLESTWESVCTTTTFLLNIQEFTDYHMSSMTVTILCYLQK